MLSSSGNDPPRRPIRWRRRLLIGGCALLVVVIAVVAGGYGYIHYRLDQIKRVDVAGEAAVGGGQPMTVLVAGSDSRAGESAAAAQHFGSAAQVAGQRSDVIVLIHIDPRTNSASMLSIPRDTVVTLAGTNEQQKINVAFDHGPSQLVQTITQTFGIQINHVVQVTFQGVQDIDQAVGGVCMTFPYPARDGSPTGSGNESGLNIPTAGPHVLNGAQALSLLRSRYYQYYKDGQWIPEGTGDLGRIIRQHEFLRALAAKALHEAKSNPFKANSLATDAVHDVTVDRGFSANAILGLVTEMRSLQPSTIPSWTLPTRAVNGYGNLGDVLLPEAGPDQATISQWVGYNAHPAPAGGHHATTTTTLAPSQISVEVLNGSGLAGQAGRAAAGLHADGFTISGTGDAPSFGHATSVVLYGQGGEAAARTVSGYVEGGAGIQSEPALAPGQVELVTGTSLTGIGVPGAGAGPAAGSSAAGPSAAGSSAAGASGGPVPPWDPTPCSGQ